MILLFLNCIMLKACQTFLHDKKSANFVSFCFSADSYLLHYESLIMINTTSSFTIFSDCKGFSSIIILHTILTEMKSNSTLSNFEINSKIKSIHNH